MSNCPKCGKDFVCELESGKSRCWCFGVDTDRKTLEAIEAMGYTGCLCRNCLVNLEKSLFVEMYFRYSRDN